MRRFVCLLALSCLFIGSIFGAEKNSSNKRVYVNAEQLFINEEGMQVIFDQETLIPITSLLHDERGYSVLQSDLETYGIGDRYTCPNGHSAPMGRGRCNNPGCPHFAG